MAESWKDAACFRHFCTKEGNPMPIEPTLYIDPQAQVPAFYCPVCGGARYAPSLICLRCERARP